MHTISFFVLGWESQTIVGSETFESESVGEFTYDEFNFNKIMKYQLTILLLFIYVIAFSQSININNSIELQASVNLKGGIDLDEENQNYFAFRSGSFDFKNNLWLDISGNNNDLSLINSNALSFHNDVTITLDSPVIGVSVSSVNDNEFFNGVSISSGNILIDYSELTDTIIYKIILDDGQEFRLTTNSDIVFSNNTWGILSGTEDIEWSKITINNYHGNLQYGFSRYVYVDETAEVAFGYGRLFPSKKVPFEVEWEGYVFESLANLFQIDITEVTYDIACRYEENTKLKFTSRTSEIISFEYQNDSSDLNGWIKIKLIYNGNGLDFLSNFQLYINDELKNIVEVSNSLEDGAGFYFTGNALSENPKCLIKNFYFKRGNEYWWAIKNGIFIDNMVSEQDYIYVPATNNTDWLNQTATNPSYNNSHNGAETEIKFPLNANLDSIDDNNYLYENGIAKEINVNNLYSKIDDYLYINNKHHNKIYDLIVNQENDYTILTDGVSNKINYLSFRTDCAGEGGGASYLDYLLLQNHNAKGDVHTTYPISISDNYPALIQSGQLAMSMHDLNPAFWKYGTYSEGLYHYDSIASPAQRANGTVIQDQGIIGGKYGDDSSPQYDIESFYALFGYAYPEMPDSTDNNEIWWKWIINNWKNRLAIYDGNLYGFSILGALPAGLGNVHADVRKMFDTIVHDGYGNKGYIMLTDSLDNQISIFNGAKNDTIVLDDSDYCQKLKGNGTVAWGNLYLGRTDWMMAPYLEVSFDIKNITGNGNVPLQNIILGYYIQDTNKAIFFDENINVFSNNYYNVLQTNTWYNIKIIINKDYYKLGIYQNDSCVIYTDEFYLSRDKSEMCIFNSDGEDCLIKNVQIYASWNKGFYDLMMHAKWDDYINYNNELYDEWVLKIKQDLLDIIFFGWTGTIFSHYIMDPEEKDPDGTYQGVIVDRSYNGINEIFSWWDTISGTYSNSRYVFSHLVNSRRENKIANGDFIRTFGGLTKENNGLWGHAYMVYDSTETADSSICGNNVGKLLSGQSETILSFIGESGWYWLEFYLKGDCNIWTEAFNRDVKDTYLDSNRFISTSYRKYKIPIYFPYSSLAFVILQAQSSTYFQNLKLYKAMLE